MATNPKQQNVQGAPAPTLHQGERGRFWRRGEPLVWTTAAALAGMLTLVFLLLAVVLANGLGVFWPKAVAEVTLTDGTKFLGQRIHSTVNPDNGQSSTQFKTANREEDPQRQDFRWIKDDAIAKTTYPAGVCVLERAENGDFYGFVKGVAGPDLTPSSDASAAATFSNALGSIRRKSAEEVAPIAAELFTLSNQLQETRGKLLRLNYRKNHLASDEQSTLDREIDKLETFKPADQRAIGSDREPTAAASG